MRVGSSGLWPRPAVGATQPSPVRLCALAAALFVLPFITPCTAEGQTLIFDRFEREAAGPAGWTLVDRVTAMDTPTATPTDMPTVTPTATLIPDGGSCDDPADCASGNCVDDTCCVDTVCPPTASCNNPGNVGVCSPDPPAAAPALSQGGRWMLLALLIVVGLVALQRRRSPLH